MIWYASGIVQGEQVRSMQCGRYGAARSQQSSRRGLIMKNAEPLIDREVFPELATPAAAPTSAGDIEISDPLFGIG